MAKFLPGLGAIATAMSCVVGAFLLGFVLCEVLGATLWAGSGVVLGAVGVNCLERTLG